MEKPSAPAGALRQAWLVILLALLYGGALAAVQTTLGPIIARNKRDITYKQIPQLVSGAEKSKTVERTVVGLDGSEHRVYQAIAADGAHKGWVLPAGGQGFADRIDLLIGLDAPVTTITGLYVLDQKETPGLGNLITGESFCDQFAGKSTVEPIDVVKSDSVTVGNEICALSGATISSDSVAHIVNSAIANLKVPIRELDLTPAPAPDQPPRRR